MSSLENIKKSEEKPKYKSIVDNVVYFFACLVQNISTRFYKFHGLENLPKGEPFLLISNHPGNFDYFPLKSALDEIGIDIHFLAHKNLLSHPLTKEYSQRNGLLGVRRFDYDNPEKIKGSTTANAGGIREGIKTLKKGKSLGIFIAGEGYLKGMDKIFGGYKLITKKLIQSGIDSISIVPVTISGYEVHIHPSIQVSDYQSKTFEDIEMFMKGQLTSSL